MRTNLFVGAALVALAVPFAVHAQEVSSSIGGQVLTSDGAPVGGAQVIVTHVPTGTRSSRATGADGGFEATGLRVGGPFSVVVTADGYQGQTIEDIQTGAGGRFSLNLTLESASAGETIVVTASRLRRSGLLQTGSETIKSSEDIFATVSASRDLRDVARRDPLSSFDPSNRSLSIAGAQARANRFTVDGVQVQDEFGLNQGGLPSLRGIVSLEAIAQFSVKAMPLDVSQGNFTGGTLDAILKSGSNEYHGAGYYIIGGKGLTGRNVRGAIVGQALPFRDYGAFISGPIIKDKLFLALNYERLTESNPIITAGISGEGAANVVPNIGDASTFADDRPLVDGIIATTNLRYRYDPLNSFVQSPERDRKISGKLDWNITDGQRLSLTYIDHFNAVPSAGGGSSNSPTTPNLGLKSNSYDTTEATKIYTGQLNSNWTDDFSTEVRVSYRKYDRGQVGFNDQGFAEFQICSNPTSIITGTNPTNNQTNCGTNSTVRLGTDTFRHSNALATNNLNGQIIARYRVGDHRIKFALEAFRQRVNNIFIPQSRGVFYFDSIADFNAGQANRVTFTNALTGDPATGAASVFTLNYYSAALQDEWQVTPELTALIGARFDLYREKKDDITRNTFFEARYPGLTNTANLNNRSAFQPRFGINWQPTDDLKLTGGVGVFSGGVPLVLYSNSFANDGARLNSIDLRRNFTAGVANGTFADANNATTAATPATTIAQINASGAAALNNVDGFGLQKNPVVNTYLSTNLSSLANATTNSLDQNFRINTVLRYNLNATYDLDLGPLGDKWKVIGDVAVTDTLYGYVYTDLRAIANGRLPDGRPRYAGIGGSAGSDLRLQNTSKGLAVVMALGLSSEWSSGLSISGAYTRSRVRDVNSNVNNSTANGGYGVTGFDPNRAEIGRSSLEVRNQGRLEITYRKAFFDDYETVFSAFGTIRDGRPFTYTMNDVVVGRGNVFGTILNNRHQIYVPNVSNLTVGTNTVAANTPIDSVVQFSGTAAQLQSFKDFILGSPLAASQGKIVDKGTGKNPGFSQVDLHFSQEVPTFIGKSRFTVFADMENFLNVISDKFAFRQFGDIVPIVDVACLNAAGAPVTGLSEACASYRYSNFRAPVTAAQAKQSLWTVRLGVRFDF